MEHDATPWAFVVAVQVSVPELFKTKVTGSPEIGSPVLVSLRVPDTVVDPLKLPLPALTVSVVGSLTERLEVVLAAVS